MEKKVISWSLLSASVVLVFLNFPKSVAGISNLLLPIALLALGIDLLGQQSPRRLSLVLGAVAAVLAAARIYQRLA